MVTEGLAEGKIENVRAGMVISDRPSTVLYLSVLCEYLYFITLTSS